MREITKLPWHVEPDTCEGKVFGFSIFAPKSKKFPLGMRIGNVPFVAEHNEHHIVGEEEARKAAQLAAAAPELLRALIEERRIRQIGQQPDVHWESMRDLRRNAYEVTDAVIAKATGVES